MKFFNSLAILIFCLTPILFYAQQDASLSAPDITPNPLSLGLQGDFSFTVNNVNGSYPAADGLILIIEMSLIEPVAAAASVSGSGASSFSWSYDPALNILTGTQIGPIGILYSGQIVVDFIVTGESTEASSDNGFVATITNMPIDGNTTNNLASSYTWTCETQNALCFFEGVDFFSNTCENASIKQFYGPFIDVCEGNFGTAIDELGSSDCECDGSPCPVFFDFWEGFYPDLNGEITIFLPETIGFEIFDGCGGNSIICGEVGVDTYTGLDPNSNYYLRFWPKNGSVCELFPETFLFHIGEIVPVELGSFKVENLGSSNKLDWVSLSEINTTHYEIQRSSDSKDFITLDKVKIDGNSLIEKEYSFKDNSPLVDNYYRLKMVDTNGDINYSEILYARNEDSRNISLYPNPANNKLFLDGLESDENISIFDIKGSKLMDLNFKGSVDISLLPEGLFYIKILETGEWIKFLKNK